MRGFKELATQEEDHANRYNIVKLLIPDELDMSNPNVADWSYTSRQTNFTPVHWLAYWNDHRSIDYILRQVEKHVTKDKLERLMIVSSNNMTPIDIAGKNNCREAAIAIMEFFISRPKFMELIFEYMKEEIQIE